MTISGRNLMKKMGLTVDNLLKDKTRVSAAEGTTIKVWGFIPVKLKVKDQFGEYRETNNCLYFADKVLTNMVYLGALKNLGCVSKNFPYPDTESSHPSPTGTTGTMRRMTRRTRSSPGSLP